MQQNNSILTPSEKRKYYFKENQRRYDNARIGESIMVFINNKWRMAVKR